MIPPLSVSRPNGRKDPTRGSTMQLVGATFDAAALRLPSRRASQPGRNACSETILAPRRRPPAAHRAMLARCPADSCLYFFLRFGWRNSVLGLRFAVRFLLMAGPPCSCLSQSVPNTVPVHWASALPPVPPPL